MEQQVALLADQFRQATSKMLEKATQQFAATLTQTVEDRPLQNVSTALEPFSGHMDQNWTKWLKDFDRIAVLSGCSKDAKKLILLPTFLRGAARYLYDTIESRVPKPATFKEWADEFTRVFPDNRNADVYSEQFALRHQRPGETALEFATSLRQLASRAFPNWTHDTREAHVKTHFLAHLQPSIRRWVQSAEKPTLDEAIGEAMKQEIRDQQEKDEKAFTVAATTSVTGRDIAAVVSNELSPRPFRGYSSRQRGGRNFGGRQHTSHEQCFGCGKEGHLLKDCWYNPLNQQNNHQRSQHQGQGEWQGSSWGQNRRAWNNNQYRGQGRGQSNWNRSHTIGNVQMEEYPVVWSDPQEAEQNETKPYYTVASVVIEEAPQVQKNEERNELAGMNKFESIRSQGAGTPQEANECPIEEARMVECEVQMATESLIEEALMEECEVLPEMKTREAQAEVRVQEASINYAVVTTAPVACQLQEENSDGKIRKLNEKKMPHGRQDDYEKDDRKAKRSRIIKEAADGQKFENAKKRRIKAQGIKKATKKKERTRKCTEMKRIKEANMQKKRTKKSTETKTSAGNSEETSTSRHSRKCRSHGTVANTHNGQTPLVVLRSPVFLLMVILCGYPWSGPEVVRGSEVTFNFCGLSCSGYAISIPKAVNGTIPPLPSEPMTTVRIELWVKRATPITVQGYKCTLWKRTVCTRYAILGALGSKAPTSDTVEHKASNFNAHLVMEICWICNTRKEVTSPYHPQTNGLVNRFNKTLAVIRSISSLLIDSALNFRSSPYHVDLEDYVHRVKSYLGHAWTTAQKNICEAQRRQQKHYDKKATAFSFAVGDQVMLHSPVVQPGKAQKLTLCWKGPYRVVDVDIPNVILVPVNSTEELKREQHVHVNRIKPYNQGNVVNSCDLVMKSTLDQPPQRSPPCDRPIDQPQQVRHGYNLRPRK